MIIMVKESTSREQDASASKALPGSNGHTLTGPHKFKPAAPQPGIATIVFSNARSMQRLGDAQVPPPSLPTSGFRIAGFTSTAATMIPSSYRMHKGTASINWDNTSGGVNIAPATNAPTIT